MIRIFEIFVALLIVVVLAAVVGVLLPSHGHIERRIEVSSPLRQVYDSVDTFRRYPQWSGLRGYDPATHMTLSGPESGPGAKVAWTSSHRAVGDGSLEIVSAKQDEQVRIAVDNDWVGTNKTYTVNLVPSANGKTVSIRVAYDVDYGWNLLWRYGGLYINGDPASIVQGSLNSLAALLAGYPNTDYSAQDIRVVDVAARPVFLVNTSAPRTLDEVQEATDAAMAQIEAAMAKAGLTAAGPRMTITTRWDTDEYRFAVAVPVDATTFTLDDTEYTIETPVKQSLLSEDADQGEEQPTEPTEPGPGDKDRNNMLIVDEHVRAALWYQGKALVTDYTGSPAALPLLRLNQRAYAETHGYLYNPDSTLGRFWDELVSTDAAAGEQEFRVYLPIQL
ncbi:MAG: hypothetical protein J0H15_02580 [Xanthomonadales bacterium]|nr:hypothetical protein [Xanthomonadales bacterium]